MEQAAAQPRPGVAPLTGQGLERPLPAVARAPICGKSARGGARLTASTDSTWLMAAVLTTTSSYTGTLPPTSPVLPPWRGVGEAWTQQAGRQRVTLVPGHGRGVAQTGCGQSARPLALRRRVQSSSVCGVEMQQCRARSRAPCSLVIQAEHTWGTTASRRSLQWRRIADTCSVLRGLSATREAPSYFPIQSLRRQRAHGKRTLRQLAANRCLQTEDSALYFAGWSTAHGSNPHARQQVSTGR